MYRPASQVWHVEQLTEPWIPWYSSPAWQEALIPALLIRPRFEGEFVWGIYFSIEIYFHEVPAKFPYWTLSFGTALWGRTVFWSTEIAVLNRQRLCRILGAKEGSSSTRHWVGRAKWTVKSLRTFNTGWGATWIWKPAGWTLSTFYILKSERWSSACFQQASSGVKKPFKIFNKKDTC